jgi:hypothetical protein
MCSQFKRRKFNSPAVVDMQKNSQCAEIFKKPFPISSHNTTQTPNTKTATRQDSKDSISSPVSNNTRSASKRRESNNSEFSFGEDDSFEFFTDSQLLALNPLLDNEDAESIETDGGDILDDNASVETNGDDILGSEEPSSILEQNLTELAKHEQESHLALSNPKFGLPNGVIESYGTAGITSIYQWQHDCLVLPRVLEGTKNIIYAAPTRFLILFSLSSAGKTFVAELLVLQKIIKTKQKGILELLSKRHRNYHPSLRKYCQ